MRLMIFLAFIILSVSCTKTEIETVKGNVAPRDHSIEKVTIENYITRSYILVMGREPDDVEFDNAFQLLNQAGVDSISRWQFLNNLFTNPSYLPHLYSQNKIDLLNNADTSDFTGWITLFNLLMLDSANVFQFPFLLYEIDRMTQLQSAFNEFTNGLIGTDEVQRRMCNNYIYDQINMGSANFVISTFQHLINRNPTGAEQNAGVSMVDGFNSVLFLEAGSTKGDYLDIISHCNNYYEAQVVFLYLKYLNRLPNTFEMSDGALKYKNSGDYTLIQKEILSGNEFIGIS